MRTLIACSKLFIFVLLSLLTIPLQALGLVLFGRHKWFYLIPHLYHNMTCAIFNVKVKIKGQRVDSGQVLYVGNHLSYIDIPVLGGNMHATFIAKEEVKSWPIFGILGSLSKTVYIKRDRNAADQAIQNIEKSLNEHRSLILFPEGTSTNGTEILPFKSSLFELFLNENLKEKLTIQPFTLTIDPPQNNDLYAWYGDMEMAPHLWQLAKSKGVRLTLIFHPPRKAKNYTDRKVFAKDCHGDTLKGLDFHNKAA